MFFYLEQKIAGMVGDWTQTSDLQSQSGALDDSAMATHDVIDFISSIVFNGKYKGTSFF